MCVCNGNMVSERDKNYNELVNYLKTCEQGKILEKDLEKAIFKYVGTIDPRSQQNTIRKLLLGDCIKFYKKKPITYMIMV